MSRRRTPAEDSKELRRQTIPTRRNKFTRVVVREAEFP